MATLTRGQTFGATETVTNTKLHNLVDNATVTNIVDADISASAAIQFSKLLASSISGALLTNLNLVPAAAGLLPFANIPVPFGSSYVSLVTIPNQSLQPLTRASWVDGVSLRNLASTPVDKQIRYNLLVSSIASGDVPAYNGANNWVGRVLSIPTLSTFSAGAYAEALATTARDTNQASYTKLKQLTPTTRSGTATVSFDINVASSGTVYGKVYINDVATGTEQSTASATPVTKSENFVLAAGDVVSVYGKIGAGGDCRIANLALKAANPIVPQEVSGY